MYARFLVHFKPHLEIFPKVWVILKCVISLRRRNIDKHDLNSLISTISNIYRYIYIYAYISQLISQLIFQTSFPMQFPSTRWNSLCAVSIPPWVSSRCHDRPEREDLLGVSGWKWRWNTTGPFYKWGTAWHGIVKFELFLSAENEI